MNVKQKELSEDVALIRHKKDQTVLFLATSRVLTQLTETEKSYLSQV